VLYREFLPAPDLAPVVHRIWVLRASGEAGGGRFQRALPDGRAELIFNLAARFERRDEQGVGLQPQTLVVGPTTRHLAIRPTGETDLVGVRFRRGAVGQLLRDSSRALLNGEFELAGFGRLLDPTLAERLAETPPAGARRALVEDALRRALRPGRMDSRIGGAIRLVTAAGGRQPMSQVARGVGLSYRQLARRFTEQVGMGPALLRRVARFQRVLPGLEHSAHPDWATLAAAHGYFDQAHLARDFRAFAGLPPGGYLREGREVTRHFIDSGAH